MNCYDCAREERGDVAAVAVCIRCGAGMCLTCSTSETRGLHQLGTLGRPITGQTRALVCRACDSVLSQHPDEMVLAH